MSLARPEVLWLLLLLPLWAVGAVRRQALRDRDWLRIGQLGRPCGEGSLWWLLGSACVILALSQPRWGQARWIPLPAGHDVVLAIDVSRSMGVTDAVPDRLGVAIEAATSLVKALGAERGDRVAVVAFSGRGVSRCPMTDNLGAVVQTLQSIRPGTIQPGGKNLAAGLASALDAFDDQNHSEGRSIVLFSDGEDHAGGWQPVVDQLANAAVIVHTVAIGDAETGHPVPSQTPGAEPVRFEGSVVLSQRLDAPLESIANETGGAVLRLGLATIDLGPLYRDQIEPEARSRRSVRHPAERAERFAIFLLVGLSLILFAFWPKRLRISPRRRWLMAPALAILMTTGAGPREDSAGSLVEKGRAAFANGRFEEAAAHFESALAVSPLDPVLHYNAAAALFPLGRFDDAMTHYLTAKERGDAGLRVKIDYALGNTAFMRGELAQALEHYDRCLQSVVRGSAFDRVRSDAAINRAFVVEQAKRRLSPPDDESGSSPKPPDPKKPPDKPGDGTRPPEPEKKSSEKSDPNEGDSTHPGSRGQGGAGGSATAPPETTSASDALFKAMENVREAQRRRIDPPPPLASNDDRKDW